jgi:hypothetical protein
MDPYLRKLNLPLLMVFLICLPAIAFQNPAGQGGARVDKPFKRQVTGAQCYQCYGGAGKYAGLVAFGFPDRSTRALAFTIGPLKDALSPGQENNKPYSGPGDYSNIGISGKSQDGKTFVGFGTVTVSADEQTGTFKLDNGTASGTWDCGHKLVRASK